MDLLDRFRHFIKNRLPVTDDEMEGLVAAFTLRKVKKKQFIIQPGFTVKHRNFVLQGAFRSYVIDKDGIEHTIQFAVEDWWISDINSYQYQRPATMFAVALEDSIILQVSFETEQHLKQSNHTFETFFRIGAERTAAFHQRRIISSLTLSAEERYNEFTETYPDIVQRLPQYALASYLGMTTEFLSRIRRRKAGKKS
ncbi:MAG TPA: Crp/Fnr family transcriptional regulator [Chitinophagaceae bacterium]|nr:Crp/Fnr family transcriptional regulator [Chitinophagaceae bacterium]